MGISAYNLYMDTIKMSSHISNENGYHPNLRIAWSCMLFQHFDWDLTHQVLFVYIYFAQPSYELERMLGKCFGRCSYFGAEN